MAERRYAQIGHTHMEDFGLQVAMGKVRGHWAVNKFGLNTDVDSGTTADVWSRGLAGGTLIWVAPTAARIHQITSTSTSDTSGGAGAKTIRVYGLTSWTAFEVSEDITMNGTGNVPTTNAYVIIHRMQVLTKGASGPNVGTITATADTDGTVTAEIAVGKGQTQMAIYGVPTGYTLCIKQVGMSANKAVSAGRADVDLLVNPEPQTELLSFIEKHRFGLNLTGSSTPLPPFDPPLKIEGPAIVKLQAQSSTNDMSISAWWNGYLVKNTIVT